VAQVFVISSGSSVDGIHFLLKQKESSMCKRTQKDERFKNIKKVKHHVH